MCENIQPGEIKRNLFVVKAMVQAVVNSNRFESAIGLPPFMQPNDDKGKRAAKPEIPLTPIPAKARARARANKDTLSSNKNKRKSPKKKPT